MTNSDVGLALARWTHSEQQDRSGVPVAARGAAAKFSIRMQPCKWLLVACSGPHTHSRLHRLPVSICLLHCVNLPQSKRPHTDAPVMSPRRILPRMQQPCQRMRTAAKCACQVNVGLGSALVDSLEAALPFRGDQEQCIPCNTWGGCMQLLHAVLTVKGRRIKDALVRDPRHFFH